MVKPKKMKTSHSRRGEIYPRAGGTFDWRLIATRNGKSVATSGGQGFADRRGAREAFNREFPGIPFEDVER